MAASVATSEPVNGLGLALVKQELECGVCLDLYERPVTLACGHSLCEGCAKHMVGMEKSGSAFIRCPHCRAKTRWKSGKANLKVNITLQNMVDRVKKAQKADEEKRKEQEAKLKREQEQEAKREAKARAAKAKAKESSSSEQAAIPEVVRSPIGSPPALDSALTKLIDAAGSASPPPAVASSSPPREVSNGKALAKGKEKKQTLSAEPFAAIPLEEDEANFGSFTNPDAVAAFDAAIAALVSQQDARGRGQDQSEQLLPASSSSPFSPASPLGVALHGGAQELSLPSPSLYTQADQHVLSTSPDRPPQQRHLLLDLADEATAASSSLPLPFAEESYERKRERKERRRERSSRSGRDSTGEWDDGRDRLSRSCRSPVHSPTSRGRSEHRSRSQDTDRRSRSQSRGRSEKSVTIVYDGIPQEYFQMLVAQGGPLQQVEQATNCKIEATTQQGKTRGIAISGHPDDVRQARKQLVALIREEALQQDRWASSGSSGETNRAAASTLVKKKMNISRRQYEMLLSNDLQLLHSIEATTDTSVIFPTNINARAASVPITISGKREGVNITVDFLKANEEATGASGSSSSGVSGHPARSQSATVPVAPRSSAGTTRSSLSSTRSATHSRRRRRKIPATEGRVPNCLIS